MKNKKVIIVVSSIIGILLISLGFYFILQKHLEKKEIEKIVFVENLETEFLSDVNVSDFIKSIDGKIVDDYKIDTTKVGKKEIKFSFTTAKNKEIKYSYTLEIKDTTPPVIWLNNTYNKVQGSEDNLVDKILCADNYDDKPKCEIIGDYDLNEAGAYSLKFKATDSSGNVKEKDFTLNVTKPAPSGGGSTNTTPKKVTLFEDVIADYKTDKTQIGIDVSKWQGDIDFKKLKEAGVEFVFIRVGTANGINGERILDPKFEQNIKNANSAGIPVGIYYYSYANSKKRAIEDANWVIEQIKDYKVDLPVAFDWENWGNYNKYNLSFYNLTEMAKGYLDVFKDSGYNGLLYSSKTYLENMWMETEYSTWLAHYTKKTSYEKEYSYWQICNNGKVDGINGEVDIDIRYLD